MMTGVCFSGSYVSSKRDVDGGWERSREGGREREEEQEIGIGLDFYLLFFCFFVFFCFLLFLF